MEIVVCMMDVNNIDEFEALALGTVLSKAQNNVLNWLLGLEGLKM